jgi:hypothetical protein
MPTTCIAGRDETAFVALGEQLSKRRYREPCLFLDFPRGCVLRRLARLHSAPGRVQ